MTKAVGSKGQSQKPPKKAKRTKRGNNKNDECWPEFSALLARILFISHTAFALWCVCEVYKERVLYYLIVGLGCLILETSYTLGKRQGKEYKW